MIRFYLLFTTFVMTMGCLVVLAKPQKRVVLVMSQDLQDALIPEMRFEGTLLSDFLESTVELTASYRGNPNPSVTVMTRDDVVLIYFNQGKAVVSGDRLSSTSITEIKKELPIDVRLYGRYQWITLRELIFYVNYECEKEGIQILVKSLSNEDV